MSCDVQNKFMVTIAMPSLRRIYVVGGIFTGFCVSRDMQNKAPILRLMKAFGRISQFSSMKMDLGY